jgi:hypothetical protein
MKLYEHINEFGEIEYRTDSGTVITSEIIEKFEDINRRAIIGARKTRELIAWAMKTIEKNRNENH